jgi:hypothetical protein
MVRLWSTLLLLLVVIQSSLAQDFESIGTIRTDVASKIQGIQLPPYCSPTSVTDQDVGVEVPPNLVVTIVPSSEGSAFDVRTFPPNLVTPFIDKTDNTLGFHWNVAALDTLDFVLSDEDIEVGMIIQIPNESFKSLQAYGGGITIRLLTGATHLSNIVLRSGANLQASFDHAQPSLSMNGYGTSANISSEQGVKQVHVTDDAILHLHGNVESRLEVIRANVYLEGLILMDDDASSVMGTSVDAATSSTSLSSSQIPNLSQSSVSFKAVLTVNDASVCKNVLFDLGGECVVDPGMEVMVDFAGGLTSGRPNLNETLTAAASSPADSTRTCVRYAQSRDSFVTSSSSSSSLSMSVTMSSILFVAAAVQLLLRSSMHYH